MMMMTMKLTELNKFLTLLMFRLFFSLLSGSPNEPLFFVKVTEKRAASENHSDLYGHFISAGKKFLSVYFKLVQSGSAGKKL